MTYSDLALNGDIAGLCARTDNVAVLSSHAGFNRGQIRGAVKLAFDVKSVSKRCTI